MNVGERYWNPLLETLPQEELRKLQLKKFQRIFQWAYTHSKFHRFLYDQAGITPGSRFIHPTDMARGVQQQKGA